MQRVHCRAVRPQPLAAVCSSAPRPAVSNHCSSRLCAAQAARSSATQGSSRRSSGETPAVDSSQWGELTSASPSEGRRTATSQLADSRHARSNSSREAASSSNLGWYTGAEPLSQSGGPGISAQPWDGTSSDSAGRSSRQPASSRILDNNRPAPGGSSSSSTRHRDFSRTAARDAPTSASSRPSYISAPGTSSAAKQQRDKKAKKKAAFLALSNQPCCYGCGAPLQTEVAAAAGYVLPDKFAIKQKHKQLHQVLCARCSGLCNGAMIPAVQDFTQKAWAQQQASLLQQQQQQQQQQPVVGVVPRGTASPPSAAAPAVDAAPAGSSAAADHLELLGKVLISPEQLREKITEVRSVKAVVVLLVDLLDASGTLMSKVRDMVGNNPIILVGTKMDLLPAGCRPKDVAEWLAESAGRRRLQVASCHLVSSHTGEGIAAVTGKICRERKGRDVFVIGAANVGKSAFVRAMLKEMSRLTGGNFDAAAMSTSRYLPVESAMPGTTLGLIALKAFETGGTLYDTPGVHLHHRIPHMLTPEELKLLHPRRRLSAFCPPTPMDVTLQQGADEEATGVYVGPASSKYTEGSWVTDPVTGASKPRSVSATYIWGGLVRVDVQFAPPSTCLVFYGPKSMRVYDMPLLAGGSEVKYSAEVEDGGSTGSGQELFCQESVAARGGLTAHRLVVQASSIPTSACLADVAVSGLPGWVGVYAPFTKQDVHVVVWAPRGVEVFLRPPLPCPAPPRQSGADDPEELVEVGGALDAAESDQEWQAHKANLGLGRLSAQDEEVVKMLLFGDEGAGLEGIIDVEEEGDEWGDDQDDGDDVLAAGDDDNMDDDDDDGEGGVSADLRMLSSVGRGENTGQGDSRRQQRGAAAAAAAADMAQEEDGEQGDIILQQLVAGVPVSKVGNGNSSSSSSSSSRRSGRVEVNDDALPASTSRRHRAAGAVAFDTEFGDIYVDAGDGAGSVAVDDDDDGEVHDDINETDNVAIQQQQEQRRRPVLNGIVRRRRKVSSRV